MSSATKKTKPPHSPTSFRFDDELKAALKVIAERESRSMANAIEWLAKDYFKQKKLAWPAKAPEELNQNMEKSE